MKINDKVWIQRYKQVYAARVLWVGKIMENENGEEDLNYPCYCKAALVESMDHRRRRIELVSLEPDRVCETRSIRRTERAAIHAALRWLEAQQRNMKSEATRAAGVESDAAGVREPFK